MAPFKGAIFNYKLSKILTQSFLYKPRIGPERIIQVYLQIPADTHS